MKLYLIRHGEYSKENGYYFEISISEEGIEQGKQLLGKNVIPKPDQIYSSHFVRAKESAQIITQADIFVFDASDLMPPAVGNQGGFWDACKKYIQNPDNLDAILKEMEETANKNY